MSVRLNLRETIEYAIENHIPDCPPGVAELISQQVADTLTCDLVTLVWGSPGHVETVNFGGGEYATSLRLNERGRSVVLDALHSLEEVQSEWSTPYVAAALGVDR